METWDILDKWGKLTGRSILRDNMLKEGEYHLVVHIWIRNSKDEILIQRRPEHLKFAPGIWAIAGGCAVQGEDSSMAAYRETKEELGISINPKCKPIRYIEKNSITDVWLVEYDININHVEFDIREVSDVKWVTQQELKSMIHEGEFYRASDDYYELLFDNFQIDLII